MSSSRTLDFIRSRNLNINNCNSLKRLTAIAYTLCQATFIMEKVKKYIESRLTELNEELKVYWMSEGYYENRKAKIEELELMLRSLNVA